MTIAPDRPDTSDLPAGTSRLREWVSGAFPIIMKPRPGTSREDADVPARDVPPVAPAPRGPAPGRPGQPGSPDPGSTERPAPEHRDAPAGSHRTRRRRRLFPLTVVALLGVLAGTVALTWPFDIFPGREVLPGTLWRTLAAAVLAGTLTALIFPAYLRRASRPAVPGRHPGKIHPGSPASRPAREQIRDVPPGSADAVPPRDVPATIDAVPAIPAPQLPGREAREVFQRPAPGRPARPASSRPGKKGAEDDDVDTIGTQWGKLQETLSPGARRLVTTTAFVAGLFLAGVIIAPVILSAHDIIAWAQNESTDAGLGLSKQMSWVAFGALDAAALVAVLIRVICTVTGYRAGAFTIYIWAFAGFSAFANHSQGSRPGAPGDAWWFFPMVSVAGVLLLETTLALVRKMIRGKNGGKRAERPSFPIKDWLPIWGSPQETFGAWRAAAALSIETPEGALTVYRTLTLTRGWWARWRIRAAIRDRQVFELQRVYDAGGVLSVPGILPAGNLIRFPGQTDEPDPADVVAPVRERRRALPAATDQGQPPAATLAANTESASPAPGVTPIAALTDRQRAALQRLAPFAAGRGFASWAEVIVALDPSMPTDSRLSLRLLEQTFGTGKSTFKNALAHEPEANVPWGTWSVAAADGEGTG